MKNEVIIKDAVSKIKSLMKWQQKIAPISPAMYNAILSQITKIKENI